MTPSWWNLEASGWAKLGLAMGAPLRRAGLRRSLRMHRRGRSGSPGQAARIAKRTIIDLRTNHLTTAAQVVEHPELCKQRFSPQRWAEFSADVAFFRSDLPTLRPSRGSKCRHLLAAASDPNHPVISVGNWAS